MSDPAFAPFWKKAEELGALVVIHPNGFTHADRFTRFYFNNVIGNPLETTIALHYLIFDGVLERHPNLKILAVHGGGYLGAYSGRIDHAWGARSDSHGDLPKPPTSYLKKIYFDTVVFTPIQLEALVKTFGADHVVMGTDYPFDMADFDPIEHVVSSGLDAFPPRRSSAATRRSCSGSESFCSLARTSAAAGLTRGPSISKSGSPGHDARPPAMTRGYGSGDSRPRLYASRKSSTAVSVTTACALLWRSERACSSCVRVACR